MKVIVNNQADIDQALANDDSPDPRILFELEITEKHSLIENLSIGEVNGYFLSKAIDYIETLDIYDDYDSFTSDSYIAFDNDDGEEITYKVRLTLEVEN